MKIIWSKYKPYLFQNRKRIIYLSVMIIIIAVFAFMKNNQYISEYIFARGISRFLLNSISSVTSLVPFSLTEWTYIIVISLLIFLAVRVTIHFFKKNYKSAFTILYRISAVAITMVVIINVLFTFSYNRYSVVEEFGLIKAEINIQNAYDSAEYYITKASVLSRQFERDETGAVVSPYTFEEIVELINNEYSRLTSDYFSQFSVKSKPLVFSKAMCYMGFSGMYFPYYAESNISVAVPSYSLPLTICHELAHSRGVMREDEANLTAYYLLTTSENDYLKYCALLYASNICLNETYDENNLSYFKYAKELISSEMKMDYSAGAVIWDGYDTFLDDIGDFFNDIYLKGSGVPSGIKSYSQTGVFLIRLHQTIINGKIK